MSEDLRLTILSPYPLHTVDQAVGYIGQAQVMACGLLIIATEATGIRELITCGVEGIVVPAPAMVRLLPQRSTPCSPTPTEHGPWALPPDGKPDLLVDGDSMGVGWLRPFTSRGLE